MLTGKPWLFLPSKIVVLSLNIVGFQWIVWNKGKFIDRFHLQKNHGKILMVSREQISPRKPIHWMFDSKRLFWNMIMTYSLGNIFNGHDSGTDWLEVPTIYKDPGIPIYIFFGANPCTACLAIYRGNLFITIDGPPFWVINIYKGCTHGSQRLVTTFVPSMIKIRLLLSLTNGCEALSN